MLKMDTLRAAITNALPELKADPNRLRMWVEGGAGQMRQTETLGFGFTFKLSVLVIDMATDIAVLALAIFEWLRVNQPDLLAPGNDGFKFDVDVLDDKAVDVLLELALTQNVAVTMQDGGKRQITYLAEPDPLWDDLLGLGGAAPIPPLAGVALNGDALIEG